MSNEKLAEHRLGLLDTLESEAIHIIREVVAEFERTRHWVLRLRGEDSLLASEPKLAESIRLRNPYIDPISFLQVDLLARWRASGSLDDTLLHALVATVNGVAQGLQNTG